LDRTLRERPDELTRLLCRLDTEYQQLQVGRKKGENGAADGDEGKESSLTRLKKQLELQEQLTERKKRPAAPVEKPIEPSR
jgi:hypothetical protein